jgi:hypothetical protein
MMTVEQLIAQLQAFEGHRLVVMAKDSEGNDFSPLDEVYGKNQAYRAESTWSGDARFETLTPELANQGYGEEDVISDGVPAIVLWPTN